MGANARTFHLAGRACSGAELTTWVVAESARGSGCGKTIMAFLQSRYEVLAGMGLTEAALRVYLPSAFVYMRAIPRSVRIFDLRAAAKYARVDGLGERLIGQRSAPAPLRYRARPFTVERDGAAIEACAAAWRAAGYNHYARDATTCAWRYGRHPVFRYDGVLVSGAGEGVAVFLRIDEIDGFRILHVLDVFGDERDIPLAVAFLEDKCRDERIAAADFYCVADRVTRHFRLAGWFSTLDDEFVQLMHLFHPPEFRTPPTTSLVYWARADMLAMMETSRLYITKQDLDLDRPTGEDYEAIRDAAAGSPSGAAES